MPLGTLKCLPHAFNGWLYLNEVRMSTSTSFGKGSHVIIVFGHHFASKNAPFRNLGKNIQLAIKHTTASQGQNLYFQEQSPDLL